MNNTAFNNRIINGCKNSIIAIITEMITKSKTMNRANILPQHKFIVERVTYKLFQTTINPRTKLISCSNPLFFVQKAVKIKGKRSKVSASFYR